MMNYVKMFGLILLPLVFMVGCSSKTTEKKADIKSTAVMDGLGRGTITFTNKGKGAGAKCVAINVFRRDFSKPGITSPTYCSGSIKSMTTKEVTFYVAGVESFCELAGKRWHQVCAFTSVKGK